MHCGAAYGQRHLMIDYSTVPEGEPPSFPETNWRIVRTASYGYGTGQRRYERHTWDGEAWWGGQPPFCTYRCAHSFACEALKAGFRSAHTR